MAGRNEVIRNSVVKLAESNGVELEVVWFELGVDGWEKNMGVQLWLH